MEVVVGRRVSHGELHSLLQCTVNLRLFLLHFIKFVCKIRQFNTLYTSTIRVSNGYKTALNRCRKCFNGYEACAEGCTAGLNQPIIGLNGPVNACNSDTIALLTVCMEQFINAASWSGHSTAWCEDTVWNDWTNRMVVHYYKVQNYCSPFKMKIQVMFTFKIATKLLYIFKSVNV